VNEIHEEEPTPEEMREMCSRALEEIRLELRRYVAENYEPVLSDKDYAAEDYVGTNHHPEHI
jgi:hypothetical protein